MKRSGRAPAISARRARTPLRRLRILVVENHPDMRRGLEVFLESLGHRPQFAEDLGSALDVAQCNETFDLLLSDIHLPDGNGWDLPSLLEHSGRRPLHAIAMSGFGSLHDLERSRVAGFRAHLVKPGSPGELEAALAAVAAL